MNKSLVSLCIGVVLAVVGVIAPIRKENVVSVGRGNGIDYVVTDGESLCEVIDGINALLQKGVGKEETGVPIFAADEGESEDGKEVAKINSFSLHTANRLNQSSLARYSDNNSSESSISRKFIDKEMDVYISGDCYYYISKGVLNNYTYTERTKKGSDSETEKNTDSMTLKFDMEIYTDGEIILMRFNEYVMTRNGETTNYSDPGVWIEVTGSIVGSVVSMLFQWNNDYLEMIGNYFKNNQSKFSVENGFYRLKDSYLESFLNTKNGRFTIDLADKTKPTIALAASVENNSKKNRDEFDDSEYSSSGSSSFEEVLSFYNINNTMVNFKQPKNTMNWEEWSNKHSDDIWL